VRGAAAMAANVAALTTPKITLTVGPLAPEDSLAMCGPGMAPTLSFTWPGGRHSYSCNTGPRLTLSKPGKVRQFEVGSAWHSAAHLRVDDIIAPRDTRTVLKRCLDIVSQKDRLPPYVSAQFPVLRL